MIISVVLISSLEVIYILHYFENMSKERSIDVSIQMQYHGKHYCRVGGIM